ncbi:hypothetical protein ACFT8W_42005 [Streptomyces hygroscopicus]|uniref:hypothetical protein n=1 Tax=Streptomyces hygroscopicus TaxID=1912 RepID=UPI00362D92EF
MATYYTGVALRDQQKINLEQRILQRKSQALQVGFWYANGVPKKDDVAVVSNRSPDPLYQLMVAFTFPQWIMSPTNPRTKRHDAAYYTANVPPCTRIIFTKKALHSAFDRIAKKTGAEVEQPVSASLWFQDAQGIGWSRSSRLREVNMDSSRKNWESNLRSGKLFIDVPYKAVVTTQPEPHCEKD